MGGFIFNLTILILAILATKEFIKVKDSKKITPNFVKFISYIIVALLVLYDLNNQDIVFATDYRIIAGLFLTFLLPTVLYHDHTKYNVRDAFYLVGGIFFLGIVFRLFILLYETNYRLLLYLFTITIITDTFSYFTGYLIGRHKLLENISPKKTWEGLIGGTIMGVFVSTVFFNTVIDPTLYIDRVIIMSTFLSILGQLGDLVFSY